MILGYKQYFPFNGEPTYFREKIKNEKYNTRYLPFFPKDKDGNYQTYIEITARKKHSIREDKFNRWKPGMIIQHAYGVRTKNYECFAGGICISIQQLEIKEYHMDTDQYLSHSYILEEKGVTKIFRVYVDGKLLTDSDIYQLALNDGFDCTRDFFRWFNKPFKGKIIHWTNLKY